MKAAILALLPAFPAVAHTISMSTAQLTVDGSNVLYELRMPTYELQHVPDPGKALPDAIHVTGAQQRTASCSPRDAQFVCRLEFVFPEHPQTIEVSCTLARITVANHVHVPQARNGDRMDQAVFEGPVERVRLRFRQIGPVESAIRSRPSILLAMIFAALTLVVLSEGWLGGAVALLGSLLGFTVATPLTPRFLEAAIALISAYSGFEAAVLPRSRYRLIVSALLGFVIGCYLHVLTPGVIARASFGVPVFCAGLVLPAHKWLSFGLVFCGLLWFGFLMRT